ncbi:hypothetical protein [Erwinia tasmaniensis]|uniref:Uncharacterized protein n=1 Tax=Erwinia tasmaniensis (strain DSM 17950 / CFBP 7177 / CIP 109463 / NCPPB 4357 / Et1/99) TaxID=465817 RepID=B2VFJ7_ERWT9|nr:hypothetical protein [Erwinia tasmaniensis]CAO96436.1 hypothetical protein ETA_13900 [Erwinia tasmaniensis Et1/99]
MNTELSPSPAYFQRHDILLQQRSTVQSADVIQQLNRALLAGERVSAAFYDLTVLKLLQQRKTLPLLTPEADEEISRFIHQLKPLLAGEPHDSTQFARLQHEIATSVQHFPWQQANLSLVQYKFFLRTYLRWRKTLAALYGTDDNQRVFIQLEKVLKKSGCRVALLGDAQQLYQLLAELLVNCRQKEAESTANQSLLTNYIAAADIATRGIIAFAATAEALLRDNPLPTAAQLEKGIKQHHLSVIERTHPWFNTL